MESTIFAYIARHSWRQQLIILALTLLSFPPLYFTLVLPKTIINRALSGNGGTHEMLGYQLDQLHYLFVLCGMFLALVLISGLLKYVLNVYAGIVAERMLRRIRYQLYDHVLRFPLPQFRRVSQGELVQMVNAETEALGGYVGDALAVPAFQGGTLITTLTFMFMQDPILGFAAVALYPLQMYLIPKLQRQVNQLGKRRIQQVRRNAERISETALGVRDIRANATASLELSRFSQQLGEVFWIRFDIYKKKFLIKFLNNFIAQLGPFFFFSIGGYLVIQGQITLGALVAVVGAQKDLASPWRELLTYYQTMYDVKIKYEQVVVQFAPPGLRDESLMLGEPETPPNLDGPLRAVNVTLTDDQGETILDGLSFELDLPKHVAITGPAGAGKEELTLVLAGLLEPHAGRVILGEAEVGRLPDSVLGRNLAYVGGAPYIFAGTIEDNLLYGLKQRPIHPREIPEEMRVDFERAMAEARRSGNSPYDLDADWVDYAAAGITDPEERLPTIVRVLETARLDDDVYGLGLRGTVPHAQGSDLASRLLEARKLMRRELAEDPRIARLVEHFDPHLFNGNATVAENLLFGAPIGNTFEMDRIAAHPYVLETLDAVGLTDELRRVGLKVAETMVELFADLPPDHEYFRQFSFIDPEELPEYKSLIGRADPEHLDSLSDTDRERLLSLPFKLITERHRLGVVDDQLIAKLLDARAYFREHLPDDLEGAIAFFDPEEFNPASTIQENILFGKVAYGQAQAGQRIGDLLAQVVDQLDLRARITEVGLQAPCGVGGGRLTAAQRQKLALARAVLKRPRLTILYDGTANLDPVEQVIVRDRLLEALKGRSVIWAVGQAEWATHFEHVLALEAGRIVAQGPPSEVLDETGTDGSMAAK